MASPQDEDKKILDKLEPLVATESKAIVESAIKEALERIMIRAYRVGFADGNACANIKSSNSGDLNDASYHGI